MAPKLTPTEELMQAPRAVTNGNGDAELHRVAASHGCKHGAAPLDLAGAAGHTNGLAVQHGRQHSADPTAVGVPPEDATATALPPIPPKPMGHVCGPAGCGTRHSIYGGRGRGTRPGARRESLGP